MVLSMLLLEVILGDLVVGSSNGFSVVQAPLEIFTVRVDLQMLLFGLSVERVKFSHGGEWLAARRAQSSGVLEQPACLRWVGGVVVSHL